mmetsp:Transcript_24187/g.58437  ORF Transcript_24187/g.58437 Transcript_24187/m.58437 type:complete len:200 (-) Transcript_24187:95-694(-)
MAAGILVEAELGVLDLVIVDPVVETNDHSPDVFVLVEFVPILELDRFPLVLDSPRPRDPKEVKLLANPDVPDHIHALPSGLEVDLVEVGRRRERRRENLLGLDFQSQGVEFLLVSGPRFSGVVGDEVDRLAEAAEVVEGLRDSGDQAVAFPYDSVTVEYDRVDAVEERLGFGGVVNLERGRGGRRARCEGAGLQRRRRP